MSFAKWELLNKPTSKQEDWACSLDDGKKKTGFTILPVPRITSRQLWTMFVVFCCSCLPSEAWTPTTTLIKSASCPSIWETCFDYSHGVHVQDGIDSELRAPQIWTPTVKIAELDNGQIIWKTWFNGSGEAHVKTDIHHVELTAPQKWPGPVDCTMHNLNGLVGQYLGGSGTPDDAKNTDKVIGRHLTTTPSGNMIVNGRPSCPPESALGASRARYDLAHFKQHLDGGGGNYDGTAGKCQSIGRLTTTSGNIVLTNSNGCPPGSALGADRARYDLAHLRQHLDGGGNYDGAAGKCQSIGRLTATSGNIVLTNSNGCPPESAAGASSAGMII